MFGLITSSIASGQIVSRTGRYKPVMLVAVAVLIVGQVLLTALHVGMNDTDLAIRLFVAGLGIGPTFAVFTIIVQNAVPFHELGAATADLTLFRQIGTTVGIAMAYTVFRVNFTWDLLREQVVAAGAPAELVPTSAPPGFDIGQLTSVGGGGADFLSQIPAQLQAVFVQGFHGALTTAIANSLWLGVGAAVVALVATVALREIPLRTTLGAESAPAGSAGRADRRPPLPAAD
jgi:MFS family permease